MTQTQSIVCEGLKALSLDLSHDQINQLVGYTELLHQWNQVHNFTREKTIEAIVQRHILNSLAVCPFILKGPCMDVGSGPGLPGIPLAIAQPKNEWFLIESRQKRVVFLKHCVRVLGLNNVFPVHTRLEKFVSNKRFACIIARAFCPPHAYVKQVQPFLDDHGQALLMVGRCFEHRSSYGEMLIDSDNLRLLSAQSLKD